MPGAKPVSLKSARTPASRSMWASLLLHAALILWLGVFAPFANRTEREAALDDYVTQVAMIDFPEPKVIEPDPPTPKVPELVEEETPLEKIHEVVVENPAPAPAAVSAEPSKLAEPAGAPSWAEVKLKYRPAPSISAAPAPASGSTAGGKGASGAGSGSTGESTGAGPQFVQAKSAGPGTGTGTSPFLAAAGSSNSTGIGRRARLKSEISPSYPESMRRDGQTAVVLLLVNVGINGRAQDVKVLSENVSSEFIEPAISAVRNARYEPALENGKPIASNLRISIRFVLQ